jgi:hypothetical protein
MDRINEASSGLYEAYLYTPAGDPVTLAQLSGLTLTLLDPDSHATINGRDGQNILNANNVTVADVTLDGATIAKVSWSIQVADTPVLNDRKDKETRVALFKYTWSGGQHHHRYTFQVQNLQRVPAG